PAEAACRSRCGRASSGATRLSSQAEVPTRELAMEDRFHVFRMQVTPSEPVDVAADLDVDRLACGGDLGIERGRTSGRVRPIEDGDAGRPSKRFTQPLLWERPERANLEQADGLAFAP